MYSLVRYGDEDEPTQKALRISETKYLVLSTMWGRIETYVVDCENATCDCPYFQKLQEEENEIYCNHIKAVLAGISNKGGHRMLDEALPDTPTFKAYDPEIHELEDFGPDTPV